MSPNRYRPQDDFGRRDDHDSGWEARDRRPDESHWNTRDPRYDESRSWSEGDGGRTADAWRDQGRQDYGARARNYAHSRQDGYGQWGDDDRTRGYGQGYGSGGSGYSTDRSGNRGDYGQSDYRTGDYGRRDQGNRAIYGRSDYPDHGYAPGAQIWEGSGRGLNGEDRQRSKHEFEPDYLHWREQQLSGFDRDYSDWRSERREKFSADFDNWRSSRPKVQADNPIVGDISEGGTGDASKIKNR